MDKRSKTRGVLIYVASFVFPFFGLAYGALERCKEEKIPRRRGKICITLGIAGLILICGGAALWLILGFKAGFDFLLPE